MTRNLIYRILQHRGLQVLLLLGGYFSVADTLPLGVHQGFYALSLTLKDLLLWVMPLCVCVYIAHTIQSFKKQAPLLILTMVVFEAVSNMSSVWYGFSCAHVVADSLPVFNLQTDAVSFSPLWRLPLLPPPWWAADRGVMVGVILGCLNGFYPVQRMINALQHTKNIIDWTLVHFFGKCIPLFVLGFCVHMHQTHLLDHVWGQYSFFIGCLLISLAFYLSFLFLIGAGGHLKTMMRHIRNLLPAGGLALTSGSSLSVMPWTIAGVEKNLVNPELAKAVIPATTNIQQIGDCIAQSFFCFLIYRHFFGINPDLATWASFSVVFVLARFATAAVLGGAIFLMLPIYELYLGFTPDMIALILAFNVILDPFITSANVLANGALCAFFERVWGRVVRISSFV